jgi:CubicO group peptidase (beta-lactamase class C family)
MKDCQLKGMSVGIVKNDKLIFVKNYGSDTLSKQFLLGNLSQPFTALLAMKLYDNGILDIDKNIVSYLPWFKVADTLSEKITVRHLLNHSSGIPLKSSFVDLAGEEQPDAFRQSRLRLSKIKLAHEPGEDYTYSALNYKLLGLILEKVSGQTFDTLLHRMILQPLAMKNTIALEDEKVGQYLNVAYTYTWLWSKSAGKEHYSRSAIPSGYIASNVNDMSLFLRAMIRSAVNDSSTILCSPKSMQTLLSPFNTSYYGMGWMADNWEGERIYFQQGLTQHYSSYICFIPDEKTGIILLSNINNLTSLEKINDGMLRILQKMKVPVYFTTEKYFRLAILFLIGLVFLQLMLRLLKWSIQHWNFKIRWNYSNTSFFVIGIIFTMIWLYVIPNYFQMPISALIAWQPDMGISLITGAVLGTINTFIQLIIRSNHHKHVKKRKQAI